MNILEQLEHYAHIQPHHLAIQSLNNRLTYEELHLASDSLAAYILATYEANQSPIAIYGHKSPFMFICMLACAKSGHAYCPIDISMPASRIQLIFTQMNTPLVLAAEHLPFHYNHVIDCEEIHHIIHTRPASISPRHWVKENEVFYIIFTSGSTGNPKGVQITANCLNHFLEWSITLAAHTNKIKQPVFLNQAPCSFDLSVMDIYTAFASGSTLWTLSKDIQNNYPQLQNSLRQSHATVWVSTPSFADICLSDKAFNSDLMQQLTTFIFCGETLTNATVSKLMERFPKADIINTYGPTESTVAITSIQITPELNAHTSPLPVGHVKPGTFIEIRKKNGSLAADREKGEIIILGNTVSCGYYQRSELNEQAFFTQILEHQTLRGYHTGDEGYLQDGILYYCGRLDLQIKLHGYRIELEDIEQNILKLKHVSNVVVLPNIKEHKVKSLTAYIIYDQLIEDTFAASQTIRQELKTYLPDYMIPKKIKFLEHLPLTNNGKINRNFLGGSSL